MGAAQPAAQAEEENGTCASGEAFLYSKYGLAAFEVGPQPKDSRKVLVCVPGLTDGLLSLRYMPMLAEAVRPMGWRVIQPLLSSSYRGWGQGSLDEDVAELDMLLEFLKDKRSVEQVVLLGHSTGCQDVVRYLSAGKQLPLVGGAILQAPVSDRECVVATHGMGVSEELSKLRQVASTMIAEGKGDEAMPRAASKLLGPPDLVTAYRFDSLTGHMTDDDMFSSDLTDEELQTRLGHIAVPTLIAISADDEYVPKCVDSRKLGERLMGATAASAYPGLAQLVVLEEGGHSLRLAGAQARFSEAVGNFLKSIGPEDPMRVAKELVREIRQRASSTDTGNRPFMVGLVGMPGAGKSTITQAVKRMLGPDCLVLGMDGFHTPLADLKARPDAADAVYRRGAPDTFEPGKLRKSVSSVRDFDGPAEVVFPGFDHAVGDPTEIGARFDRSAHRIIIMEGNYLLHEGDNWESTADLFDFTAFLNTDIETCVARVKARNVCIPGYTPEEIDVRTEKVDRANAEKVSASQSRADIVLNCDRAKPD